MAPRPLDETVPFRGPPVGHCLEEEDRSLRAVSETLQGTEGNHHSSGCLFFFFRGPLLMK